MDVTVLRRAENFNPNFYYETKCDIDNAFLLKYRNGKKEIWVAKMNYSYAKRICKGKVKIWREEAFKKVISGKVVGLDFSYEPVAFFQSVKKYAKKIVDISESYRKNRMKKRSIEVAAIKKAVKESLDIIYSLDFNKLKTERDVEIALKREVLQRGLELAFQPIVASGENSRFPHYAARNVKLKDHVLIDFGVRWKHYCADITEVLFLKRNDKIQKMYEKIKDVFYEIVDNLNQEMTGKDVHKLYLKAIKNHGLRKMPHAIGHGVGLEVHEWPRLNEKSGDSIASSTIAIEPAFYGRFGVRYERIVFVGKRVRVL